MSSLGAGPIAANSVITTDVSGLGWQSPIGSHENIIGQSASLGAWEIAPLAGSHASSVHATMSSTSTVTCVTAPVVLSHASVVQGSLSSTSAGVFTHVPIEQVSVVHASLSSQSAA